MQPAQFTTDMLTDVLEGNASLPELARKLKVTLADFLDWFFTESVQQYLHMYKAANFLIAEARISVNAPALIDRLPEQMGHPSPSLSIRASNTLADFVLREMRPPSRKSATESRKIQNAPLPEQPGSAAGLERAAKAREEEFRAFRPDDNTPSVRQADPAAIKPSVTAPSTIAPTPHTHPAQAHPAPLDATPQLASSPPTPDQPTQLQTPAPEPLLLQPPDPSPHHTRDKTTPHPEACAA